MCGGNSEWVFVHSQSASSLKETHCVPFFFLYLLGKRLLRNKSTSAACQLHLCRTNHPCCDRHSTLNRRRCFSQHSPRKQRSGSMVAYGWLAAFYKQSQIWFYQSNQLQCECGSIKKIYLLKFHYQWIPVFKHNLIIGIVIWDEKETYSIFLYFTTGCMTRSNMNMGPLSLKSSDCIKRRTMHFHFPCLCVEIEPTYPEMWLALTSGVLVYK